MSDPFFVLIVIAVVIVAIILMIGLGSFSSGGEFGKRNSNKLMRWRLLAQFVAVIMIAIYVWFIKGSN